MINVDERAREVWLRLQGAVDATRATMATNGCELIVDGSMYSPSDRAIDGAEAFWVLTAEAEVPEAWFDFSDAINEQVACYDTDDFHLYWEDGCLWLAGPDYEHEEM